MNRIIMFILYIILWVLSSSCLVLSIYCRDLSKFALSVAALAMVFFNFTRPMLRTMKGVIIEN